MSPRRPRRSRNKGLPRKNSLQRLLRALARWFSWCLLTEYRRLFDLLLTSVLKTSRLAGGFARRLVSVNRSRRPKCWKKASYWTYSTCWLSCSLIVFASHPAIATKCPARRSETRMTISFERSGGIGGFRLTAEVDTQTKQLTFGAKGSKKVLSADDVRDLEELVKTARFFSLSVGPPAPARGSDRLQYLITIESEGKRHTVRTTEESLPPALEPLVNKLVRLAKGIVETPKTP